MRRVLALLSVFIFTLQLPAVIAFYECNWYNQVPQWDRTGTAVNDLYWVTVGPSRVDPRTMNDTSRLRPSNITKGWTHCGPLQPDVVSQISIISIDTVKQSRICKLDIRTRGGQSYSFGQHCTNGVPQTLNIFPGERILNISLAFIDLPEDQYKRNTVTLGSLCLITTYGGVFKSGKYSCNTAKAVNEPNSGLLAGVGGSTRLDDTGQEYINNLYFIFHPWPDRIYYDLSSYKFLKKRPEQSISIQDECLGNKAYCRLADTDTRVQCSLSVDRTETFSVTSSDTVSLTFGVSQSESLTAGLTEGVETGTTVSVGLTKSSTTGETSGVTFSQSSQKGVEVAEGVTVTKEDTSSQDINDGLTTSSHWSDTQSSGKTSAFSRAESRETANTREVGSTDERTRGRTQSETSTTGTSDSINQEQSQTETTDQTTTRTREITETQEQSETEGHTTSSSKATTVSVSSTSTFSTSQTMSGSVGFLSASREIGFSTSLSVGVDHSITRGEEHSASLTKSQTQAHSDGFQEATGTSRGATSTSGQSRTSSRERAIGSEASESSSQSNTMSQGWTQTFGGTETEENTFSSERMAERGGSTETSRSVGYGKSSSLSNAVDRRQSLNLVSTREASETAQTSRELTASAEKSVAESSNTFKQVMEEKARSNENSVTNGTDRTNGTEYTITSSIGFSRTVDFNPDRYNVKMWMTFEEYKDMPFRADALIYTRGLGGAIRVPVSGLLNGRFSSASFVVDHTVPIDCGGPKAAAITDSVILYSDAEKQWVLGLNPTSFRYAEDFCGYMGGHLISLTSQSKTTQLLAAIRARPETQSPYFNTKTAFWIGGVLDLATQRWRWLDGSTWGLSITGGFFANWDKSGKPLGDSACVSASLSNGVWTLTSPCDSSPDSLLPFVCEVKYSGVCGIGRAGTPPQCRMCNGQYEYSDRIGLEDCMRCTAPGVVKDFDQNGLNEACVCRAGTYGDPTTVAGCKPCLGNTYADQDGQARCKVCIGIAGNTSMSPDFGYYDDGEPGNIICKPSPSPPPPRPSPRPPKPSPPPRKASPPPKPPSAATPSPKRFPPSSPPQSKPKPPQAVTKAPPPPIKRRRLLAESWESSSHLPAALYAANCDTLFKALNGLRTNNYSACGQLVKGNNALARMARPPVADDCPSNTKVYACVQELGPYVTRLVEKKCCAQLAKVVELWRPPAAVCLTSNFLPFRHTFGFYHVAAGCEDHVMLLNGWPDGSSGRVEIYHGGKLGSVCDDGWDDDDARVVCRELGYDGGYAEWGGAFGPAYEWQPIWMHRVACRGNESRLADCPIYNDTWGLHTCSHWEDAGVTCFRCPGCPVEGKPRLAANSSSSVILQTAKGARPSWTAGRMEIWHNLNWGTVCSDWFHRINADVACRSMGYHAGCVIDPSRYLAQPGVEPVCPNDPIANFTAPYDAQWASETGIWLDNVDCYGDEAELPSSGLGMAPGGLHRCERNAWGYHDCNHGQDVFLKCSVFPQGTVRLVDGLSSLQRLDSIVGRLEIMLDGAMSSFCPTGFTDREAATACRQLGWPEGEVATGNTTDFIPPLGVLAVQKAVTCTGTESSLLDCKWLSSQPSPVCPSGRKSYVSIRCYRPLPPSPSRFSPPPPSPAPPPSPMPPSPPPPPPQGLVCLNTTADYGVTPDNRYGCSAGYFLGYTATNIWCRSGSFVSSVAMLVSTDSAYPMVYQASLNCSDGTTAIGPLPSRTVTWASVVVRYTSATGFQSITGEAKCGTQSMKWLPARVTTAATPAPTAGRFTFTCPKAGDRISAVRIGASLLDLDSWRFCCSKPGAV